MRLARALLGASLFVLGCGGASGATDPAASPSRPQEVVLASPPAEPSAAASAAAPAPEPEPVALAALLAPATGPEGESEALAAPWGDPLGDEPLGGLLGADVPTALGTGGLGLSGVGPSAGGAGGLGGIGTLGTGGLGTGAGYGSSSGRLGRGRASTSTVTTPTPGVTGSYPPEIVRRIVRASLAPVRYCYEKGLVKNPALSGKVTVQFVIGLDGAVVSAQSTSTLAEPDVESCVVAVFRRMAFPKPDAGLVQVNYPLLFRPGSAPTLAGKTLEDATGAEVEKALRDAGCSDVGAVSTPAKGTWVVTAKRDGRPFTVTLRSKEAPPLTDAETARLAASGAIHRSGPVTLVVDGPDGDAANALLREVVK